MCILCFQGHVNPNFDKYAFNILTKIIDKNLYLIGAKGGFA